MTSRGFDGATTFSPGTAMAQFSTDCECWAPNRSPAPLAQRTTSGSSSWPSDMYRLLAISLAIRSQHTAKKSLNMISATGRRPVMAAPMAAPRMACSLMGVSRTRCGPNSSSRPTVALNTPPAAATSSPRNTTRSSRRISCAIPRATASRYVTVTILPPSRCAVPEAPTRALRLVAPEARQPAGREPTSLDHRQHRPDRNRLVGGHPDLGEDPAGGGGYVGVDL